MFELPITDLSTFRHKKSDNQLAWNMSAKLWAPISVAIYDWNNHL